MPTLQASLELSFHSSHLSTIDFSISVLGLEIMHVIMLVCAQAPSGTCVLIHECKSASDQQKNGKRKKKSTVLHNNQY